MEWRPAIRGFKARIPSLLYGPDADVDTENTSAWFHKITMDADTAKFAF